MGQEVRMLLNPSRISTETPAAKGGDTPNGLIRVQTQTLRLKGLIVPLFKLDIFLLHICTAPRISWVRQEIFIPI